MAHFDRAAVERMEHAWRSRGLRVFSVVTMVTLAAYSVANVTAGNWVASLATAVGLPVVSSSWLLSRRDPMPRWSAGPLVLYLFALVGGMLLIGHENSASLMFLAAGPALAIFAFGARWGLAMSGVILAALVATLALNDHALPPEYANRFVVAFVFTTVVTYMYDRVRNQALRQLWEAGEQIEALQRLLPMCAWCGKIETESRTWIAVEKYFETRDQPVTHGLCPDCYDREMAQVERRSG